MSSPKNLNARERARLAAEQTAARKRDQRILIAVIAAFVLVVVAAGIGLQAWRTNRSPSAVSSTSASASPATITNGQPIVLGSAEAPTITLYEDFHCLHCAEFEEQFGPVVTQAQESGAARVELYPMSFIDEGSAAAANAMACAAEAGFGQPFYLGLFANHTLRWSDEQLVDLAAKVGRSPSEAFKTCVTTNAHADWVSSINAAADRNGVAQTPTLLINGKTVDIANLTPDALKAMIASARQR
jgi:protein-disulfide isomerase